MAKAINLLAAINFPKSAASAAPKKRDNPNKNMATTTATQRGEFLSMLSRFAVTTMKEWNVRVNP